MAEEKQLVLKGCISLDCTACEDVSVKIMDGIVQGEEELYHCSKCNKIYCEECGIFLHRKNKKNHSFEITKSKHIQLIQDMVNKNEDEKEYGMGKKLVIALIGEENHKKIEPYLSASTGLSGGSVAGMFLLSDMVNQSGGIVQAVGSSHASGMGAVAVAFIAGIEIAYAGWRWYSRDISGKEFVTLSGKILTKSSAAFGGVALGAKFGAVIGTATLPGIGTAIGIAGGALLGFVFGWAASKIYEYCFPNGEQAARKKAIEDALQYFHFDKKDTQNTQIFNEKEIRRRFRQYALEAHPDRNGGDADKWSILSGHYGILKGLLEELSGEKEGNKKIVDKVLGIENIN